MAKRIIWAPQAVADRIQISDYWYRRLGTKHYSVQLDEMFKETVGLLSRFPLLGRQVENRDERVFVKDLIRSFTSMKRMPSKYCICGTAVETRSLTFDKFLRQKFLSIYKNSCNSTFNLLNSG